MSATTLNLPKTQKVAIVANFETPVEIKDHPVPNPDNLKPGECLLKMVCTGVCHTDLHAAIGDWPVKPKHPLIGGHEGVGIIVAIGAHTANSPVELGQRVGVKWIAKSCLDCEQCRKGYEQTCEKVLLSGYTVNGTFSQYLVSYVHNVTPIPEGLDSESAASILCAGLTVYRALKYSETTPGDWIVIPGAGGGLGHLAIQYAKYMGRRVIAIDGGEEKHKLCMELGADRWIDFTKCQDITGEIKKFTDGLGAHAALVATATSAGYAQAIDYLRENGHLMAVGLPAKATLDASIFFTVFKSITIHGSYVGNRQDAIEAINIAASGAVKCRYQLRKLQDIAKVYEDMGKGKIAGRIVLSIDQ
uniref:alcohol dehydrogenase n=1 Tax=Pholiota microspora TaxID=1538424 RepID=I4DSQ3_PHOMI|nr:mannitol-1-phosphate dehydrogenase [Pholiota nameko]